MSNLNSPAIKRGPLLAHEMHRVTVMPRRFEPGQVAADDDIEAGWIGSRFLDTVPVQPAECCTEIGHEEDPYDGTALVRGLFSAIGITAVIAAVVVALA